MAYADSGRNAELMKRLHRWYIWKKHRGESIQKLFSSTMLHNRPPRPQIEELEPMILDFFPLRSKIPCTARIFGPANGVRHDLFELKDIDKCELYNALEEGD